jgi:hypothetical protein
MRPDQRAGSTPIIRLNGGSVRYFLWIERPAQICAMLIIRCEEDGSLFASLDCDAEPCNAHDSP